MNSPSYRRRDSVGGAGRRGGARLYELAFIQKARRDHILRRGRLVQGLYELAFIQKARPCDGARQPELQGLYELAFIQKARR